MRKDPHYRIVLSVLCVACFTGTASAANLHYILLCDTLDPWIGTVDDFANAQTWARSVADHTGLMLRINALSETRLTVANARATLKAVQPESDDVVFFHYSGHGGNPGDRKWPIFYFVSSPEYMPDDERLSFDEAVSILQPKSQRLLVIVADTCNSFPELPGRLSPKAPIPAGDTLTKAFRDLFVNCSGTIFASGSKPGQYSYGTWGEGGLFSNSLVDAVYSLAVTESPLTWEAVLAKTAADTAAVAAMEGGLQEPQYEITTTGAKQEDTSPQDTSTSVSQSENTPLAAPIPACGSVGLLPLALCATGLSLLRTRVHANRKR